MTTIEILLGIGLLIGIAAGLYLALRAKGGHTAHGDLRDLVSRFADHATSTRDGIGRLEEASDKAASGLREEMGQRFGALSIEVRATLSEGGRTQGERLDDFARRLDAARQGATDDAKGLREELALTLGQLATSVRGLIGDSATAQGSRFDGFASQLGEDRTNALASALALREEVRATLATLGQGLTEALGRFERAQTERLDVATGAVRDMGTATAQQHEAMRGTVESRLETLRADNAEKLEAMRATVDEKLQGTLEARLGASFATVNQNLEAVFKSVGEMQVLATGVGDLKRVLSNVKTRGTWGEGHLGTLLEQSMTIDQYAANVEVRPGSGERVEYAIKLPGEAGDAPIWLPIDAKLPKEDYERLMHASEQGDLALVEEASKALERNVRLAAKTICAKYIHPPYSTDFGVMFLPTEGLFAEVVRRPGLVDALNRDCRVIVAGPTTLHALLASLRMGFRTLAIQKRSSAVWQVLGAVKFEFGKFGEVMDKVKKKLDEAQNVMEDVGTRRRAVDRKLREVEALPESEAAGLLAIAAVDIFAEANAAA